MRLALVILALIAGISLTAPLWTQYAPWESQAAATLHPPNAEHLLGTDYLGRDVWSRTLYGGQHTLAVTTVATLVACGVGGFLGFLAGLPFLRGIILALNQALLAFPPLLLALVFLTLFERHWLLLAVAVGTAQIPAYVRFTYSLILQIQAQPYIEAAEALGAAPAMILQRHIFPNAFPLLLVQGGTVFSYCLLNSAALGVLGLGGDLSMPSWGVMLAEGRASFRLAPWVALAPGMAITLVIFCVQHLIDGYNQRR